MILVDVNLLIYAVNTDLQQHAKARDWWEMVLSRPEHIGIPWVSILGFLRICTNPRVFERPLLTQAAVKYIDEWLQQPQVKVVNPGLGHWPILCTLLDETGAAGNLTADAHIAAIALEQGYTVYSADNDFKRFPNLKHINPIAPG